MFWTLILGVIVLGVLGVYLKLKKSQRYWPDLGVPLAKPKVGIWKLLREGIDFIENENNLYNQLRGKKFGGFMEFFSPSFYVTDLDVMKQVYIKDFDHFVNRRGFETKNNDPHMHHSLFNQTGDAWKDLRTKMTPTFTTGKIRRMYEIFNLSSKKLVKAIGEEAKRDPKGVVEIKPLSQKLTMDVIASAAFGVQSNLFEDPDSLFAKMGLRLQDTFSAKNIPKFMLIVFLPFVANLLGLKLVDDEADKFLSKLIIDALNHRQKTGEKREDFLQLMLEARLGQIKQEEESELDAHEKNAQLKLDSSGDASEKVVFTDDVIIAQCLLFFLAGFDTTESMVTFSIYELACCPDVQERLYQEVKEALDENNGEFTYELVNKLEYLDMVVSETLRKYPPAVRSDRRTTKPFKLPGTEVVLPVGTVVVLPIYPVHHDPEYWPQPEKFDPERFTKENSVNRHPLAYQPFGHGPRNCIGNRFALMEGKSALAHLVLNFKFEPCERTIIPAEFAKSAPLKPSDNTPLTVKPRN